MFWGWLCLWHLFWCGVTGDEVGRERVFFSGRWSVGEQEDVVTLPEYYYQSETKWKVALDAVASPTNCSLSVEICISSAFGLPDANYYSPKSCVYYLEALLKNTLGYQQQTFLLPLQWKGYLIGLRIKDHNTSNICNSEDSVSLELRSLECDGVGLVMVHNKTCYLPTTIKDGVSEHLGISAGETRFHYLWMSRSLSRFELDIQVLSTALDSTLRTKLTYSCNPEVGPTEMTLEGVGKMNIVFPEAGQWVISVSSSINLTYTINVTSISCPRGSTGRNCEIGVVSSQDVPLINYYHSLQMIQYDGLQPNDTLIWVTSLPVSHQRAPIVYVAFDYFPSVVHWDLRGFTQDSNHKTIIHLNKTHQNLTIPQNSSIYLLILPPIEDKINRSGDLEDEYVYLSTNYTAYAVWFDSYCFKDCSALGGTCEEETGDCLCGGGRNLECLDPHLSALQIIVNISIYLALLAIVFLISIYFYYASRRNPIIEKSIKKQPPLYVPRRYISIGFIAFGSFLGYLFRVSMSSSIVKISEEKKWNQSTDGLVLASYYIGYLLLQIPGGYLSRKAGGKWLMVIGILISSLATFVLPYWDSFAGIFICRMFVGVGTGVVSPSNYYMISVWFAKHEKSQMASIINTLQMLGTASALGITPVLSESFGWRFSFLFYGQLGLLWCLLFLICVGRFPRDTKTTIFTISEEELQYIESDPQYIPGKLGVIPWKHIICNRAFLVLVYNHFSFNWNFYMFLSWLPTYIKSLDPSYYTGIYSLIPYLVLPFIIIPNGFLSDYLAKEKILSDLLIRKFNQSFGLLSSSVFLIALSFARVDAPTALALTMCGIIFQGFSMAGGFSVNHLDLFPRHASIAWGITNTFSVIPGILGIFLQGWILQVTSSNWAVPFMIGFSFNVTAVACWLLFAEVEAQVLPQLYSDS